MLEPFVELAAAVAMTVIRNCNLFEWLLLVTAWWLCTMGTARRLLNAVKDPLPGPVAMPLTVVMLGLTFVTLNGVPVPAIPDDWSHLFLADTLLAGRWANPPHPHPDFFEAIHFLAHPTRSSMYLFGPALWLATGKLIFGHAHAGIILGAAILTGTLRWALEAVLDRKWAFYGGTLIALKCVFGGMWGGYWLNSYWGGVPGAVAGTLIAGAVWRLREGNPWRNGLFIGLGAGLLMNTRPFEGLAFCLGLAVIELHPLPPWRQLWPAAAAATLVLAGFGAAMTAHFRAVTGHPFTLPYQLNQKTYGWPMTLPWTPVTQPAQGLPNNAMRAYWDWERREHRLITTPTGFLVTTIRKASMNWQHFLGPLLTLPFWFGLRCLPRRFVVPLLATAAAVLIEQTGYPHYLSPATVLLGVVIGRGCQAWSARRPGLVALLGPALLLMALVHGVAPPARDVSEAGRLCCRYRLGDPRYALEEQLEKKPGQHLVFVPDTILLGTDTFPDWVYNPPDIDQARIVFARDLGAARNQDLIQHYRGSRQLWSAGPATPLRPYTP
jgi:hypothetical protein